MVNNNRVKFVPKSKIAEFREHTIEQIQNNIFIKKETEKNVFIDSYVESTRHANQDILKNISFDFKRGIKNDLKQESHWSEKNAKHMTQRDWMIFREDHDISVSNSSKSPTPFREWHDIVNINSNLYVNILNNGYLKPTPIQMQLISIINEGFDCIGISRTGSGKTLAYLVPIVMKLQIKTGSSDPRALVIVPTRELANQVEKEARNLSKSLNLKVAVLIGGTSITEQLFSVRDGIDLLISTPGRLKDVLEQNYITLSQCEITVIDEVDRMIHMNYENELAYIINKLENRFKRCQVVSISATLPTSSLKLINKYAHDPIVVKVGTSGLNIPENIELSFLYTDSNQKLQMLKKIFSKRYDKILVFANTRDSVESLCTFLLNSLNSEYDVYLLHGGISQVTREKSLHSFSNSQSSILIATDIACRGLDIDNLSLVVNFEMPKTSEIFIHRVGRTGRFGEKGHAISFVGDEDYEISKNILLMLKGVIQRRESYNSLSNAISMISSLNKMKL